MVLEVPQIQRIAKCVSSTITDMKVTRCRATSQLVLILFSLIAMISGAQSPTEGRSETQVTQARGHWIDPSTGLMWAAKDNGSDMNWKKAMKYCRELRLAGYSDWRLANIGELDQIYDKTVNALGLAGPPDTPRAFTWHVKGNLFLTGNQWSSTSGIDDRGHPSGYAWRFDFNEGRQFGGDELSFHTNKRALCVRGSGE